MIFFCFFLVPAGFCVSTFHPKIYHLYLQARFARSTLLPLPTISTLFGIPWICLTAIFSSASGFAIIRGTHSLSISVPRLDDELSPSFSQHTL